MSTSSSRSSPTTDDSGSTLRNAPGVLTPSSTDATLEVRGVSVVLVVLGVLKPAEGAPLRRSGLDL